MMGAFPENHDLGEPGNHSQAKDSSISTPDEDSRKEERVKEIIEQIVEMKLRPINAQLDQLPVLVRDTILQVINELNQQEQKQGPQPEQPQQPQAQPQEQQQANMQNLAVLAQTIAPLLRGGDAAPTQDPLLEMIKGAFSKMIQAKVDETIMGTYGVRVPPPDNITKPVETKKSKLEFE